MEESIVVGLWKMISRYDEWVLKLFSFDKENLWYLKMEYQKYYPCRAL